MLEIDKGSHSKLEGIFIKLECVNDESRQFRECGEGADWISNRH